MISEAKWYADFTNPFPSEKSTTVNESNTSESNSSNQILEDFESNFTFVKVVKYLVKKKGSRFGSIELDNKELFLDHWKEGPNYYTQWSIKEDGRPARNTGQADSRRSSIIVKKEQRDKELIDGAVSLGANPDDVSVFLKEVVESANYLQENIFGRKKEVTYDEPVKELTCLNDYPEDIKKEANVIYNGDPLNFFLETLDQVHYGDRSNKELLILALFSKHVKNGKPVSVIIVGSTESGKTSLANATSKISPDRLVIDISSMSAKAAYYHQDKFREDYNHMIINDFLDSPEAIATLKAMTDTEISTPKHMTVSDDKKAVQLRIKGKNTLFVTAAKQLTDRELNRRILHMNPDESKEHIKKSKEFILKNEVSGSSADETLFDTCKAVTELIIEEEVEVIVPWISSLNVDKFGKTGIKQLSHLVKARALIYRANRLQVNDNTILASLDDLLEVLKLWIGIKNLQESYLPSKAFEILDLLEDWDENKIDSEGHYGKKLTEIRKEIGATKPTLRRWIFGENDQPGLNDLDYIYMEKEGDSPTAPWIVYRNPSKSINSHNAACPVNQSSMNKDFLNDIDKKEIIRSICTLFINRSSYSDVNVDDLVDKICKKFPEEIETDNDIGDICDLVQEELDSNTPIDN